MRYLSLFSGIEAFSVAVHDFGWEPMAFAEIAPYPSKVLAHRFPDVPNLGDITTVGWDESERKALVKAQRDLYDADRGDKERFQDAVDAIFERNRHVRVWEQWLADNGRPDIIVAGSPCQAFSVAGKRRGLEDARGNLALYTAELVRYLDPRIFLWENVPGVLSDSTNALGCMFGEIVGAGEPLTPPGGRWTNAGLVAGPERTLAWRILDAQYFGVAQRRRRIFAVACPVDGLDPAQILLECESDRRNPAPKRGSRKGLADRVGVGAALAHLLGARVRGDDAGVRGAGVPRGFAAGSIANYDESDTGGVVRAAGGDLGGGSETLVLASGAANAEIGHDQSPTLTTLHDGPPIVIQDATARAKHQNGSGISEDGTAYTLDATGGQGVLCMAPAFSKRPGQQIATRADGEACFAVTTGEPPRVLAYGCDDYALGTYDAVEVSPPITASADQSRGTPMAMSPYGEVRRLLPVECARLQGFPDDWARIADDSPDGPQYAGYGNSMAVPVMRWIAARIRAVDGGEYTYGIPAECRGEIEGRTP